MSTAAIRRDSVRIAGIVAADPSAVVPACPGWDVRDLVVHLGGVHRWVLECVETAAPPARARATDPVPDTPDDPDALAAWLIDGATTLADVLAGRDPSEPTWTPFRVDDPTVAFWIRRQTHETSVHRVDAEDAVDSRTPIEPVIAADGVDEYLELILPRRVARDGLVLPAGSAHLHCTDTEGEWTLEVGPDGGYVLDRTHRKGDAAVRATAEHLLLLLWARPLPGGSVDVIGDEAVAAAWTGLGGT